MACIIFANLANLLGHVKRPLIATREAGIIDAGYNMRTGVTDPGYNIRNRDHRSRLQVFVFEKREKA